MTSPTYTEVTRGIRVTVRPDYLSDQSEPAERRWVWAYHVTIANEGVETVQLMRRTWIITDSQGRTQRVHGPGVVGEQPILAPGEAFCYTSGTPLSTPSGFMRGFYHMVVCETGEAFDVVIPPFALDVTERPTRLN